MGQFDEQARQQELDGIGLQLRDGFRRDARRRQVRNRALTGLGTVALLGAVAVGAFSNLPGSGSGGPDATPAAATVLAKAAETAESSYFKPRELKPGEYLYADERQLSRYIVKSTKGENRIYHLVGSKDIETWSAPDRSGLIRLGRRPTQAVTGTDYAYWQDDGGNDPHYGVDDPEELIAAPGALSDESVEAFKYTLPEPDVTDELTDTYDIDDAELARLTRKQPRFNRYVRTRVASVSRKLSKKRPTRKVLKSSTDSATFSLALELLSQRNSSSSQSPQMRAALLRLAATADDELKVDPHATDFLGRDGVAVTEKSTIETDGEAPEQNETTIVFDPDTFVVLEVRDGPDQPEIDPSVMQPGMALVTGYATDYEYGIVNQLRLRPHGAAPLPPAIKQSKLPGSFN